MIRKLIRQMLTAQIFSALAVSLCLLIDIVVIGRFLGDEAMAAYQLANPLLLCIGAIGTLLSAGVQVACGRSLASGSRRETNAGYSSAVAVGGAVSLLFAAVVLVFTRPLAAALGAGTEGSLFDMTKGYLAGFSIGAPGSMGALVLVPFLQMAGQGNLLIVGVLSMTVADVALDEAEVRSRLQRLDIMQEARGEVVQAGHVVTLPDKVLAQVAADESGAAGNENLHKLIL